MESEVEQSKSVDTTSTEPIAALEGNPVDQSLLPPAAEPKTQWQQIGKIVSDFLEHLPAYLSQFYNQYKQPIISIALIIAAIVTFKLLIALLDAINDVPLVNPFLELVGIGYATWFVFRYLLKASTRQELVTQIRSIQKEFLGEQDS
jgi:ABC-type transport system involved in cytochrome bd biosynthesis fused ATPase/permease subunit